MIVRTFDERLTAAHEGRARQPFYLIVNFEDNNAAVITGNQPALEYTVPRGGAKFSFPVYGLMTELTSDVVAEIFRQQQTGDGYRIGRLFGTPQRLTLAAGNSRAGATRETPAEWFYWPEPVIIREGESLQMRLAQAGFEGSTEAGAGALPVATQIDASGIRATFLSERIHREDARQGKLTVEEIDEITKQIRTRRQRTFIVFVDVDFASVATYQGVTLPELDEWALITGFVSGTPTGGASNFLQYSQVLIEDPNGIEWSNDSEPIPVSALCAFPFDANNKQVFSRDLLTPYLVGPRRENLSFTFSQRAALGTDTTGKIGIVLRTA